MSVCSRKKCSVPGCDSRNERMFAFPTSEKERKEWLNAYGREDLPRLPYNKLRQTICAIHSEENLFLRKRLSKATVHTLHLSGIPAASIREPQKEDSSQRRRRRI